MTNIPCQTASIFALGIIDHISGRIAFSNIFDLPLDIGWFLQIMLKERDYQMTSTLYENYRIPPDLKHYINCGVLEMLSVHDDEKYLEFHVPSRQIVGNKDEITAFSLIWIHPDFNKKYCHYYLETPGDLPNFYLQESRSNGRETQISGIESIDDLIEWLEVA